MADSIGSPPDPPDRPGPSERQRPPSFPGRVLGTGARGARRVARVTGIEGAAETVAEEAIVRAIESQAAERALARVLQGPAVEEAVEQALRSPAVERSLTQAIDSEMIDRVWERLLAGEEVQKLVERIAEAPEVRAAISAQGRGLLGDIGRTVGKVIRRVDDRFERVVRRTFFRRQRQLPTDHAGAVSRALALAIDGVFVNLAFTAFVALVTLVANIFGGNGEGGSGLAIAVGSTAWLSFGAVYLLGFWSLADQTPGMRFVGIRLEERLSLRRSCKRLGGLGLAVVTFGIGFLGIVFGAERRAWDDRLCGTGVVYDERQPEPAPWSGVKSALPSDSAASAESAG